MTSFVGSVQNHELVSLARAALEHSINNAYLTIYQHQIQRRMKLFAPFANHSRTSLPMTSNILFFKIEVEHRVSFIYFFFFKFSQNILQMIPRVMDFVIEDLSVSIAMSLNYITNAFQFLDLFRH